MYRFDYFQDDLSRELQVSFTTADQASLCTSINLSGVIGAGYISSINATVGNYVSASIDMTQTNNSGAVK